MTDENVQPFHYFFSTFIEWMVDEDLGVGFTRMLAATKRSSLDPKYCQVFRVPLPKDATYQIDNYMPQVPGTEYIGQMHFSAKLLKESMEWDPTSIRHNASIVDKGDLTEFFKTLHHLIPEEEHWQEYRAQAVRLSAQVTGKEVKQ